MKKILARGFCSVLACSALCLSCSKLPSTSGPLFSFNESLTTPAHDDVVVGDSLSLACSVEAGNSNLSKVQAYVDGKAVLDTALSHSAFTLPVIGVSVKKQGAVSISCVAEDKDGLKATCNRSWVVKQPILPVLELAKSQAGFEWVEDITTGLTCKDISLSDTNLPECRGTVAKGSRDLRSIVLLKVEKDTNIVLINTNLTNNPQSFSFAYPLAKIGTYRIEIQDVNKNKLSKDFLVKEYSE